jgi:hypothetical protein
MTATSFNLRGLPIPEQPTLRIPTPDEPVSLFDLPTEKTAAITIPLIDEQPTDKIAVLVCAPGELLTAYDLRLLADFAREDRISPRTLLRRLLSAEYHRRMIGREVEAMG